jgi:predicted metalloendopeptidase
MKLIEKFGLNPEEKEQLLEELLAEKTILNVKSFLMLSTINLRIARITKSLASLKGEDYEKALETVQTEIEKIDKLIEQPS